MSKMSNKVVNKSSKDGRFLSQKAKKQPGTIYKKRVVLPDKT